MNQEEKRMIDWSESVGWPELQHSHLDRYLSRVESRSRETGTSSTYRPVGASRDEYRGMDADTKRMIKHVEALTADSLKKERESKQRDQDRWRMLERCHREDAQRRYPTTRELYERERQREYDLAKETEWAIQRAEQLSQDCGRLRPLPLHEAQKCFNW